MHLHQHSTSEFITDFEKALTWLEDLGIKVHGASRVRRYRQSFEQFVDAFFRKNPKYSQVEKGSIQNDIVNAYFEANEFVTIHKVFIEQGDSELKDRVEEILSGPERYSLEVPSNGSNKARNIAFELYTASIFKMAGFPISFKTLSDASFSAGNFNFEIECKRPQSKESIIKCIKDANKQLRNRFDRNPHIVNKKGIISLSLSKVYNPENKILVCKTIDDAVKKISWDFLRLVGTFNEALKNKVDRRVVAWMALVKVPVIIEDSKMDFSIYKNPMFVNITGKSEIEHGMVNHMAEQIKRTYDVSVL